MPRQKTAKKTPKKVAEDIMSSADAEDTKNPKRNAARLIPSGSTILNLALSDDYRGGWATGGIANLIGDSSAGKTFLALTTLAELANDPQFDDYKIIYDDAEHRNNFNVGKLYGTKFQERVQPPGGWDGDKPINSKLVGDFSDYVTDLIEAGDPFIYVLDSFDSITTQEDLDQMESEKKARKEGKEVSGSYGMYKAKAASELFRVITSGLSTTDSFVLVNSQTRANIGPGFAEKTRSGGAALKFYSDHEIWLAVMQTMKRTVNGEDLPIGIRSRAKIKKNSITGKIRMADFEIYYDYGIDDISQCIQFILKQKFWGKRKNTILADDFNVEMTMPKLIAHIEKEGLEKRLKQIVARAWKKREKALIIDRKSKYS